MMNPSCPKSYALLDSWYINVDVINGFTSKNYDVIGAIKTNREIYPENKKISIADYVQTLTQDEFHPVSVKDVGYLGFRYVGRLNGIEKAIVLLIYPKDNFGVKSALRTFICTDLYLADSDTFSHYGHRWSIETFFRLQKKILWLTQIHDSFDYSHRQIFH